MNTLHPSIDSAWAGADRPARRIGSRVELARRLYFLDFPLLLLSVGLLTWIIPNDLMLLVSAGTGAAVGLYTLWEIAIRREAIRFSHIRCLLNVRNQEWIH